MRDKRRADEIPLDAQSRFTQSHSNLVKRVSLMMQERFDNKQTSMPKRKIASQENMTVPMSLLPHQSEPKPDDSSDDSDKEEHIVRIDSPSFLFHNSRREL